MGSSATATIAWGVVIPSDDDWDDEEVDSADVNKRINTLLDDDYDLHDLFGFTEEHPQFPDEARDLPAKQRDAHPEVQAWNAAKVSYEKRLIRAVPVEFDHYGTYDYGGHVLVIKRSVTSANWGARHVTLSTLSQPTLEEVDALNKVLTAVNFTGDRTPRLVVFALYG